MHLYVRICVSVCVHVRKGGWVANVRLRYETRASASPSRPQQALQHALIARKMRESKNWNLAVIAMREKICFDLLLYLEHFGSHRMHPDLVRNQQMGNYEESNLG